MCNVALYILYQVEGVMRFCELHLHNLRVTLLLVIITHVMAIVLETYMYSKTYL